MFYSKWRIYQQAYGNLLKASQLWQLGNTTHFGILFSLYICLTHLNVIENEDAHSSTQSTTLEPNLSSLT